MSEKPFIKVHDDIEAHPKIDPLSDAAFRLLVTSWGWCHRFNTDGVMPLKTWSKRGTAKARTELATAGMVTLTGDEVHFHDYLKHQQSAAQRQAKKTQAKAAGQAGGLANGKRNAKRTASESLSEQSSENEAEVEVRERTSAPNGAGPQLVAASGLNAGDVIAAYCDGATSSGRPRPSQALRGKVGRDANRLNAEGHDWPALIAAAERMGASGWDSLDRELQKPQRGKPVGSGVASQPDEAYLEPGIFSGRGA